MNGEADQDQTEPESEALSESYRHLLDQAVWQLDVEPVAATSPAAPAPDDTPPPVHRVLEALLFIGSSPLTPERAATVIRGLTPPQFQEAIALLNGTYRRQGRPYTILAQQKGYVLTLKPQYRSIVEKLYGQAREARLSTAAIDVLSLVAYRQPINKKEVDAIRGADSGALLRQLIRRGLVAIQERGESTRHDVCYGTTPRFLELFKLKSLDDLPRTQDLQKL
jgi:segregation and condensation protein B